MSRISRLVGISVLLVLSLILVNVANARGLLAGTMSIEGRVTAVNALSDPPTLSVTTDNGAGYLLQAPNDPGVATAKTGSRLRATGSLSDGVFLATSIQRVPAAGSGQNTVARQQTTVVGVVTQMNTAANPPVVIIDPGTGNAVTVILPGSSRVADLQIGESVTATGTLKDSILTATSFTILSRPLAAANGDDDDNDGGNDNGGGNDNNNDDDDDDDDNANNDNANNDNANNDNSNNDNAGNDNGGGNDNNNGDDDDDDNNN